MAKNLNLIEQEDLNVLVDQIRALTEKVDQLIADLAVGRRGDKGDKSEKRRLLRVKDVVALTGLSKGTIYRLTSEGTIPHSKQGSILFFDQVKVENWALGNPVATQEEIERMAEYMMRKPKTRINRQQKRK